MSQSTQSSPPHVAADFLREYAARLLGLLLVILGLALIYTKHLSWPWLIAIPLLSELIPALGEALAIAGILMMFVDEAVKRRLLREASKSIFVHMIGFDHEPELKDKIKSIALETRFYQRDYRLTSVIEPSDNGVSIELTKELEILNQGLDSRPFKPGWRFTESDNLSDCEIETAITNQDIVTAKTPIVTNVAGYSDAYGPEVELEPQHKGKRYEFLAKCVIKQPADWYHPMYFEYPTIGVKFTIKAPKGWTVWVGGQASQQDEAKFHSSKLYMPADKIELHWRAPHPTS